LPGDGCDQHCVASQYLGSKIRRFSNYQIFHSERCHPSRSERLLLLVRQRVSVALAGCRQQARASTFEIAISRFDPAAAVRQSGVRPSSQGDTGISRKFRLFAYSISSPDPQFADLEVEISESLRPCPRIDYRWSLVRSCLPPEGGIRLCALIRSRANAYQSWSLIGCAAEALLLWAISAIPDPSNVTVKPEGSPDEWGLGEYIAVADSLGLIKRTTAQQTALAKRLP
jgi:hypothetical protein